MITRSHNYATDLGYTYYYVRLSLFFSEGTETIEHPAEIDIAPTIWLDNGNTVGDVYCSVPKEIKVRAIKVTTTTQGIYVIENPFQPGTANYTYIYNELQTNSLVREIEQIGETIKPTKLNLLLTK